MNNYRYKVSLRFFGQSFDPQAISAELGLAPRVSHGLGEQRRTPDGFELIGKHDASYWCAPIASGEDETLGAALDRMIEELSAHKSFFESVHASGNRAEFFVGWFSPGNSGETLPWELLEKLGHLKIDLAMDVYGGE